MKRAARLLAVTLGALCASAAPALGHDTVVRGSVQDPRGDAFVLPGHAVVDLKRVVVTYDRSAGVFRVKARLWPGRAPSFYSVKRFDAFEDCSASSPQTLYYDSAAYIGLLILSHGFFPTPTLHERKINGNHLTETWSGPLLRQQQIGCVRLGEVTTGPVSPDTGDEFATVELRRRIRHR